MTNRPADDPAVRADIVLIVIMGVLKGTIAGVAIGYFSQKYDSLAIRVLFGLGVGLLLALPIALRQGQYYWEIMLPGRPESPCSPQFPSL